MALSLDALFEEAQAAAKVTKVTISNDDKLQIYANYQQATVGPCQGSRPSAFRQAGVYNASQAGGDADCYKYDAWKALGDMTSDAAKEAYVAIMDRVDPSWRPTIPVAGKPPLEEGYNTELFHSIVSEREPTPIEKLFASAMAMVRSIPMVQFRDEDRLQLYAFHQRATKGRAPTQRPPSSQVQACAKHAAWLALDALTQEDCMAGYCKVVAEIMPGWLKAMPRFLADEQALYEVDVAAAGGLGIGISRDARGLRVENVEEAGALGRWNRAHPEQHVAAGDLILAVNGQKVEAWEKPTAYQVNGRLRLHIRKESPKPAPVAVAAPATRARQPRGLRCCWSAQLKRNSCSVSTCIGRSSASASFLSVEE